MKKKLLQLFCAALCVVLSAGTAVAESVLQTEVDYIPEDEQNHYKVEETYDCPIMEDGEPGSGSKVDEKTTLEAHTFDEEGRCTLCGYDPNGPEPIEREPETAVKEVVDSAVQIGKIVSSEAKAIGTAAVAPAAEAPAGEAAQSTSAGQNQDAVQTMNAVFENLDPAAEVRLADAEKLFSAEDAAALSALSAREQVLVLLSALGLDVGEALSSEAQAVLESIQAHTTPKDLMKALTGTVTVDGQDVECYVITLAVKSAGVETLQHYAFRKDDNTFARLTTGE